MKRNVLLLWSLAIAMMAVAQSPTVVVQSYGNYLRSWSETKNDNFRNDVKDICNGRKQAVFKDQLAHKLAYENNYGNLEFYQLGSFLNWMTKIVGRKVSINFSNIRLRNNDEIEVYSSTPIISKDDVLEKLQFVSCDVNITGGFNYQGSELIYVRNGKVTKVEDYVETVNSSGQKKIKVDLSDLVDEHSIEVSYGYSSHFPLNIGVSTNFSYFNIGIEYGMNFSEEQLQTKQHTNFAMSSLERGKYWYLMATPGVYLRYASIDCGLGNVFAKYNYNYESVYTSSSSSEKRNYFIMKPKVTFHIPIPLDFSSHTERLYISPHIGYQYVPKCSALNCWEVGIGVRFRFETY